MPKSKDALASTDVAELQDALRELVGTNVALEEALREQAIRVQLGEAEIEVWRQRNAELRRYLLAAQQRRVLAGAPEAGR